MTFSPELTNILLVDDDRAMRDRTSEILLRAGFHVIARPAEGSISAELTKRRHDVVMAALDWTSTSLAATVGKLKQQAGSIPLVLLYRSKVRPVRASPSFAASFAAVVRTPAVLLASLLFCREASFAFCPLISPSIVPPSPARSPRAGILVGSTLRDAEVIYPFRITGCLDWYSEPFRGLTICVG
jgi:CheY-like chemotaxis protein